MRTFGDEPRLSSSPVSSAAHEPGADLAFPDCACPAPPLNIDAVRFLTEVDLAAVLDAAHAACLHRCPGWPERRDGPVVVPGRYLR